MLKCQRVTLESCDLRVTLIGECLIGPSQDMTSLSSFEDHGPNRLSPSAPSPSAVPVASNCIPLRQLISKHFEKTARKGEEKPQASRAAFGEPGEDPNDKVTWQKVRMNSIKKSGWAVL